MKRFLADFPYVHFYIYLLPFTRSRAPWNNGITKIYGGLMSNSKDIFYTFLLIVQLVTFPIWFNLIF